MFGAKKSDINSEEYWRIKAVKDNFDDLPDGAFLAACGEMGVTIEDLGWFAEVEELNEETT